MQFKISTASNGFRGFVFAIFSLTALIFFGCGFLASLVYLHTVRKQARAHRIGQGIAIVWLFGLALWLLWAPADSLWWWYVLTIPLAPLGAELIQWAIPQILRATATDLDELLAFHKDDEEKKIDRLRIAARERSIPQGGQGYIPLAALVAREEAFPGYTGLREDNGWLFMAEDILPQHLFVMGSIGSGKSEFLKYLMYQILKQTEYDLFLVDGKGDLELADFVQGVTQQFRQFEPPIFRLGYGDASTQYNAFNGDDNAIFNRLFAMIYADVELSKLTAGQKHYLDANKSLLHLLCHSPKGAPQDFLDLNNRLSQTWLKKTYFNHKDDLEHVKRVAKHIDGFALSLMPLIREFKDLITRDGFSFDEARVGVFSVRTQSAGETSRQILNIIHGDLMDFMNKRQQRPTVIIVDEFQAFNSESLVKALSLGRSAKLCLVLATQDIGSVLNETVERQIQSSAKTKILLQTDLPEKLGEIAGTREIFEHSYQHDQGQVTGVGTSRVQHQHRISLNEVARLQPGEAFVIRQRYASRVQFHMVDFKMKTQNLAD